MKLTDTQKKWAWIASGALLAVHFAPGFVNSVRRTGSPPAVLPKPSPSHVAPIAPPLLPPPPPEVVAAAKYLGTWAGSQLSPNQYNCRIVLALETSSDDAMKISGHETKSCIPTAPLRGGKLKRDDIPTLVRETQPVYAELTGTLKKDDLVFTINNVVGTPPGRCDLTQFTVSPFGPGKLLAQWQEGKCGGGQMILLKARG